MGFKNILGPGLKSIFSNAFYLSSASILTLFLRTLYVVVLARYLGPSDYGKYGYVIAWYNAFVPLTSLGLQVILGKEVGQDRERGRDLVQETLMLKLLALGLLTPLYLWLSYVAESDDEIRFVMLLLVMAFLGRGLAIWVSQVVVAYEVAMLHLRQEGIFRALEIGLGILMVLAGGGVFAVVLIHGLVWLAQGLFGIVLIHRRVEPIHLVWNLKKTIHLMLRGLPLGLTTIVTIVLLQSPLLLYRHLEGAGISLGQLALVLQVVGLFATIVGSGSAAALPVLSRSIMRRDGKDRKYLFMAYIGVFLVSGVIVILGMFFAQPALIFIFGNEYVIAAEMVGSAIWLIIPLFLAPLTTQYFYAHGRHLIPLLASGVGLSVTAFNAFLYRVGEGPSSILIAFGAGCVAWNICLTIGVFGHGRKRGYT